MMVRMIGDRILKSRKTRKLTQVQLAEMIGIKQSSVSAWERGDADPSTDNLSSLAALLRISYEWLATGRGEMESSYQTVKVEEPTLETELIAAFRELSWAHQQALVEYIKKLVP
ncbi:helix-turn-helix domain-containing protein [Deefgea piscis]|uniref:helix-turn-helix domain-containing protein n=1 Tax=Deefgea piscis TaxID=2739061 RepID=UPI001C801BC1|nr:helix-turn-helix domain-containing protein [Deefgea piscis]QZA80871.1 helix-turn-helix domain-containing protein [Deefgea piscis]